MYDVRCMMCNNKKEKKSLIFRDLEPNRAQPRQQMRSKHYLVCLFISQSETTYHNNTTLEKPVWPRLSSPAIRSVKTKGFQQSG